MGLESSFLECGICLAIFLALIGLEQEQEFEPAKSLSQHGDFSRSGSLSPGGSQNRSVAAICRGFSSKLGFAGRRRVAASAWPGHLIGWVI